MTMKFNFANRNKREATGRVVPSPVANVAKPAQAPKPTPTASPKPIPANTFISAAIDYYESQSNFHALTDYVDALEGERGEVGEWVMAVDNLATMGSGLGSMVELEVLRCRVTGQPIGIVSGEVTGPYGVCSQLTTISQRNVELLSQTYPVAYLGYLFGPIIRHMAEQDELAKLHPVEEVRLGREYLARFYDLALRFFSNAGLTATASKAYHETMCYLGELVLARYRESNLTQTKLERLESVLLASLDSVSVGNSEWEMDDAEVVRTFTHLLDVLALTVIIDRETFNENLRKSHVATCDNVLAGLRFKPEYLAWIVAFRKENADAIRYTIEAPKRLRAQIELATTSRVLQNPNVVDTTGSELFRQARGAKAKNAKRTKADIWAEEHIGDMSELTDIFKGE